LKSLTQFTALRSLVLPTVVAVLALAGATTLLLANDHGPAVLPIWVGGLLGIGAAAFLIVVIPDEIVAAMSGGLLILLAGLARSQGVSADHVASGERSSLIDRVLGQAKDLSAQVNEALSAMGIHLESSGVSIAILATCACSSFIGLFGPLMVRRAELSRIKQLESIAQSLSECCPNLIESPQWLRAQAMEASRRQKLYKRLEGRWEYEVTVSGHSYRHRGKCRFTISPSGELSLSGERQQTWLTGAAEPTGENLDRPIHWEARHLAVVHGGAGDGLMFDYFIDIMQTKRHGLCIIFSRTEDETFAGDYAYVSLGGSRAADLKVPAVPDAVSCGQIVFSNRVPVEVPSRGK
jgi:hypothetical protein